MRIELSLSTFNTSWAELRRAAVWAEAEGVPGLWVMDHLSGTVHGAADVRECFGVLAALAECTTTVGLGSLVLNCGLRHPALVGQATATIQEISQGRLTIGLGAGGGEAGTPYAREMQSIGLGGSTSRARRERVDETITVIEQLWGGDDSNWRGEHYELHGPTGFMSPSAPPPILVAGFGPKLAALAGARATAFNTSADHPHLAELTALARKSATHAGRVDFECTAFAKYDPRWLDPFSTERQALVGAGVDMLVVVLPAPFDRGIISDLRPH